jgi:hypothetical protein
VAGRVVGGAAASFFEAAGLFGIVVLPVRMSKPVHSGALDRREQLTI